MSIPVDHQNSPPPAIEEFQAAEAEPIPGGPSAPIPEPVIEYIEAVPESQASRKPTIADIEAVLAGESVLVAPSEAQPKRKPTIADIEAVLAGESVLVTPPEAQPKRKPTIEDVESILADDVVVVTAEEPRTSRKPTIADVEAILAGEQVVVTQEPNPERKPSIAEMQSLLAGDLVVVPVEKFADSSSASSTSTAVSGHSHKDLDQSTNAERSGMTTTVIKNEEVTIAPDGSKSITFATTTTTKRSTADKLKTRLLSRIARFCGIGEATPILLLLQEKKREGKNITLLVELMLEAVGE